MGSRALISPSSSAHLVIIVQLSHIFHLQVRKANKHCFLMIAFTNLQFTIRNSHPPPSVPQPLSRLWRRRRRYHILCHASGQTRHRSSER